MADQEDVPEVGIAAELERLAALRERGLLTEQEFAEAKQRVLDKALPGPPTSQSPPADVAAEPRPEASESRRAPEEPATEPVQYGSVRQDSVGPPDSRNWWRRFRNWWSQRSGWVQALIVGSVAFVGVLIIGAVAGVNTTSSSSGASDFRAFVSGPPRLQAAGVTYNMSLEVINSGSAISPFCVDFTDDNNSWLTDMPALTSYDSDTYCLDGPLAAGSTRTLRAQVTAAKPGSHKMSIDLGKADIAQDGNNAFITDDHAREWSDQFVIVG